MTRYAAVLTISDKGSVGERIDTSGPAVCSILKSRGWEVSYTCIIPDEAAQIRQRLIECADEWNIPLILTTGGTGFSPRDVTPETTLAVIEREVCGIPEVMRRESMKITSAGCLSRSVAGIRKRSLIVNLPGSEKAVKENLLSVIDSIDHGIEMLLGSGSADCGEHQSTHKPTLSVDQWLRAAKKEMSATEVGMYLIHNGVVRETSRAKAREESTDTKPVRGMLFSYDKEKVDAAVSDAYALPGIHYINVWLNQGAPNVGDDIMYVLIGGDIRPHVISALEYLVGRIKKECVSEIEIT